MGLAPFNDPYSGILTLTNEPQEGDHQGSGAMVSVPLAIVIGLACSFVQSLGLTIQRKSHLLSARQPPEKRRPEWRQPLWIFGFVVFIFANVGGTIFQIGALPIVMLAPLGAVSLLYNALLAKFLLQDALGTMMITGTALILVGAVLIGYFGAVQEPPHSLEKLMSLFARPPFIALATILFMTFVCVLVVAHLAQWQLRVHMQRAADPEQCRRKRGKKAGHKRHSKLARRWSAPSLAPLDEVSETTSGVATPVLEVRDRERQLGFDAGATTARQKGTYGAIGTTEPRRPPLRAPRLRKTEDHSPTTELALIARTRLLLAVAFAGTSGTLSGVCLLLAKSGVELLVLTFGAGDNQFNRVGSWALVVIMNIAAVAQLWYLNKALRMADPTLVCPLAFCFYNISSIALGLVYFDQVSAISAASLTLVVVGIVVLLTGVCIVSMKPPAVTESSDDSVTDTSADDSAALVESPNMICSSPTETQAILASNAAGITGPHLPPPAAPAPQSQAVTDGMTVASASEADQSSPDRLSRDAGPVERRSPTTKRGHVRSRSGSFSSGSVAGLGLHLPDFYARSSEDDAAQSPHSPRHKQSRHDIRHAKQRFEISDRSRSDTNACNAASGALVASSSDAHLSRKRPSLYHAILNRGLSIGLSPSSPGFHIGPFSPSTEDDDVIDEESARDLARFQRQRGPRRVFSEADAGGLAAQVQAQARVQEQDGENNATSNSTSLVEAQDGSSAFRLQFPLLDTSRLAERLSALGARPRLPAVVRTWWSRNVDGRQDWREEERSRLLEDAA